MRFMYADGFIKPIGEFLQLFFYQIIERTIFLFKRDRNIKGGRIDMTNTIKYKGYTGSVEISEEDNCLFGKVLFTRSLLSYEGRTFEEIKKDFRDAVDDYLQLCEEKGVEPEKPFKESFNTRVRPEARRGLATSGGKAWREPE